MHKSFITGSLVTLALAGLTTVVGRGAAPIAVKHTAPSPTYTRDVAPILYQNCDSCHRAGQVAPFALTSYADAKRRAAMIAAVTQSHYMPPWKAQPGFGHFAGERRLSGMQIRTLQTWAAAGAPLGAPRDLPPLPQYPNGWTLGTPDVVFQPGAPYHLAADGDDVYRCFVIPTAYTEDRWLSGIEVHPGCRTVVHHVIAYLDTTGAARKLAAASTDGPGYTAFGGPGFTPTGALGGWVPGFDPQRLPDGLGTLLPKGADIVLQVHYHKDGKPETDLTQIGLFFSKVPVDKRVRNLLLLNPFLAIPAGTKDYQATATTVIPADITVRNVLPHMHLLGRDMTVSATRSDGVTEPLVKVTDWDFNWQMQYNYQTPLHLPKGTTVHLTAHYDNSTGNPRNPNSPPKLVTWGEQTTDEMCIAFLGYTVDSEHLTKGITADIEPQVLQATRDALVSELVSQFDADGDGKLDAGELTHLITFLQQRHPGARRTNAMLHDMDPTQAAQRLIQFFDTNGDGKLDAAEMNVAGRLLGIHF